MKKVLIAFITILALLALVVWGDKVAESNPEPTTQATVQSKYEVGPPDPQEMLELVNAERKKVGVAPLTIDVNVQKSAQLKADDFSERDYYSHIVKGTEYTLTDEMADYVERSCISSGENINGDIYTSQEALDTWLGSPPHKEAILNAEYTLTGFGVSNDKDDDYYAVQHFCVTK